MDSGKYQPPNNNPRYPIQPGQFQPPASTGPQPPPYNRPQPHRYSAWMLTTLILTYIIAMGLLFLEIAVTGGTQSSADSSSTSGSGILGSAAVLLFLALHGFIIVLDGSSFFSLFGKIRWKQRNGWLKVLIVFSY